MRIGNLAGVPVFLGDAGAYDLATASAGRFADARSILAGWDEFLDWAAGLRPEWTPYDPALLGPPVPDPGQVFGVGLNYTSHVAETGRDHGTRALPQGFTKFPSCVSGPCDPIELRGHTVDYEVELVAVVGRHAVDVPVARALDHVAGYMVGQDLSDRAVQRAGQLSLGKSFRTYAPTGPWLVSRDEIPDPQALALRCWINDEPVQDGTTADMVYGVAELIALLSAITPLRPGDLIFTGTPAGVGIFRDPPRFLRPGDEVRSEITGLGTLRNACVAAPAPADPLGQRWRDLKLDRS
ncbi:fumarylacetoacetate hydrolase family protein [Micromonospora echinofusca]|uniref:Fumarylacetoacetate hydrolase n=1 Tax=Micromonospora echinofusca TaxID=47858 RepID=A0ABS3VVJ0_MICEH|nr:fumarylacetoacetate hydrolase family protein [Micromonospora echinofusca]MBO4208530.1 fumarylacetoacetate hydrolase [Micromonospora echinofusca]